jgi:phage tail-like protein
MTSAHKDRFKHFNVLLHLGDTVSEVPSAGFQELSGITKITGLNKAVDVILKRGVAAADELTEWLDEVRGGDDSRARTVTVELRSEDGSTVQRWKLIGARIVKHTSGPMNAKGTDVAMEELVLSYERLDLD